MENYTTLQGQELNPFIDAYRQSLEDQRNSALEQATQQRSNSFAGIMAGANRRGLLYSNFPARSKLIYDTNTYYPTVAKTNQTYTTGLDTLRNNAVSLYNTVETLKKDIAAMNAV